MRTHFGTFRTALAITKQTAERFRLQTANSTRQIRPVIFPISASAPSAPAKSVSFPALFRVPLLRFGVLSLRSILRMFLGGHESSPATAAYTAVCLFRFSVLLFRSSWCARSRTPRGAARQRRESSRPSPPGTYCVPRAPPSLLSR